MRGPSALARDRLSRQWAGAVLLKAAPEHRPVSFDERKSVIIYGAGTIGIQLLRALNETGGYKTVAFIDPNPSLAGHRAVVFHGPQLVRARVFQRMVGLDQVIEGLITAHFGRRAPAVLPGLELGQFDRSDPRLDLVAVHLGKADHVPEHRGNAVVAVSLHHVRELEIPLGGLVLQGDRVGQKLGQRVTH